MKNSSTIRLLLIAPIFLISIALRAQSDNVTGKNTVTTVGVFNPNETKSGYMINDYYVELNSAQVDTLIGRKVCVTGELMIIKGMDNAYTMEQGSYSDRKFIVKPRITYATDDIAPPKN